MTTSVVGRRVPAATLRVRREPLRLPLLLLILWWLLKLLGWLLLSVVAGGALFGFAGTVLAVPVVAVADGMWQELRRPVAIVPP